MTLSDYVAPVVLLILSVAVLAWVVIAILEVKDFGYGFVKAVLKAATILASFRIVCLWCLLFIFKFNYDPFRILLYLISAYPEGVVFAKVFKLDGTSWTVFWTFLLSVVLAVTTFTAIGIFAGIAVAIRRLGGK